MARAAVGRLPSLLVVAGHDPSYEIGNGAGVDADREAAEHFGVDCLTVVTAWTEQADGRVESLGAVQPGIWLREASMFLQERRGEISALKFGLLPSEAAVRAAAELVRGARKLMPRLPIVVDPVLAASGGEALMGPGGRQALIEDLMCQGIVLTPNRPEACDLTGAPLGTEPAVLAEALFHRMAGRDERLRGLVLKGGHGGEDPVCDVTVDDQGRVSQHRHARLVGASMHGSGCRHASAVAANLALGLSLEQAAEKAGSWLGSLIGKLA